MKRCMLDVINKLQPDPCTDNDYTEFERLIDGFAIEILNLLCGEYTEDSDKCSALIKQTPKNKSRRKAKSMLLPMIDVLESLDQ